MWWFRGCGGLWGCGGVVYSRDLSEWFGVNNSGWYVLEVICGDVVCGDDDVWWYGL